MKKSNFLCLISVLIGTNTACFAENLFDVNRTNLTGDWDGKRTALADKGIKFDASSNLDIAYLADGGYAPRQDPTYVSQFSLGSGFVAQRFHNYMILEVLIIF